MAENSKLLAQMIEISESIGDLSTQFAVHKEQTLSGFQRLVDRLDRLNGSVAEIKRENLRQDDLIVEMGRDLTETRTEMLQHHAAESARERVLSEAQVARDKLLEQAEARNVTTRQATFNWTNMVVTAILSAVFGGLTILLTLHQILARK